MNCEGNYFVQGRQWNSASWYRFLVGKADKEQEAWKDGRTQLKNTFPPSHSGGEQLEARIRTWETISVS